MFEKTIEIRKRKLKREYDFLIEKTSLFNSLQIELADYMVFRSIENSKNYFIQHKDGTDEEIMVPIADLIPYSNTPNCFFHYSEDSKEFVIESLSNINAYEELSLDYGTRSQFKNLFGYGITVTNPVDDIHYYTIRYPNPNDENTEFELVISRGISFNDFIGEARGLFSNDSQNSMSSYNSPLSVDNEISSIDYIKEILNSQLGNYEKTKEEYWQELCNSNLSLNTRNIYNVLIEEQIILRKFINSMKIIKAIINYQKSNNQSSFRLNDKIANIINSNSKFTEYFQESSKIINDSLITNIASSSSSSTNHSEKVNDMNSEAIYIDEDEVIDHR